MSKRPTIEQARAQYPHRFTMQHVPAWALKPREDGTYYAPQYRTDSEWYANTTFPGEPGHVGGREHCYSVGQSWPMGQALAAPFNVHAIGNRAARSHRVAV